ncbi:MAG TPA: sigma-70 family RNA polymerase sigma factor [Acidimicrobiales bacterium]|nr:sigma-70 family RNA polymerase sigma factor [Acidimicrobiales bacterium]
MAKFAPSGNAVHVVAGEVAPELDWELLYDMHAPKLRRVVERRVGTALADDVLQETFLRAFKNRASIDPSRPIEPWLITIALRTAADLQRLQFRTLETADETVDDIDVASLDSVEEELLNRARRVGIKHAFASLNTRQRRLLQLVTIEGMSYEGVANAEQMTPDAVKSALARARTNFKTSYMGFERESGLFGGFMVLGLLNRMRKRLQRYQAFVGGHMAGVGAAATTVAVVAIAAVPAVRTAPTSATERVQTSTAQPSSQTNLTDEPRPVAPVTATAGSDGVTSTDPQPDRTGVTTSASIGRTGNQAGAQFDSQVTTPGTDRWTWGIVTIECNGSAVRTTGCAAVDEIGTPPPID